MYWDFSIVNNNSYNSFWYLWRNQKLYRQKEINLVVISAFRSMRQNQVSLERAKFANFNTSHEISSTWKNNLVFYQLAKKRNLQIGQLMKFWWFFKREYFFWDTRYNNLFKQTNTQSSLNRRDIRYYHVYKYLPEF